MAGRVVQLDVELRSNRDQLTAVANCRALELFAMPGVGAINAAALRCIWSHPGTVDGEAATARIAWTLHSPWQRPTNEDTNGLLRQHFPENTELSRRPTGGR